MTQHDHRVHTEGCYRCELSLDEQEPETVLLADGVRLPLMEAVCCRSWPVVGFNLGKCGLCGERPHIIGTWKGKSQ